MPSKKIVRKSILFLMICLGLPLIANAQTLKGKVVDTTDFGLPGVAVSVNNGASGTITDIDGNYVLTKLKKGDSIVFTYVGMQPSKYTYSGQSTLNVTLKEDSQALEEVVVVGYGQQKKESVVGSITQTKGEELLKAGSVTTVSEALTGILPGVSTMQAAGQPGSTAANILIRGQSSWTDNTPLYLVDGVERDFNDLDPNEIESISVLKDASATAVYGVKAANGVILVTTKSGLKGKTRINVSANFGVKSPTIQSDYMADYPSTLEHFNMAMHNDNNFGGMIPQSTIDIWADPNRDLQKYSYTDYITSLLGTGTTQSYNMNITGGNDFVTYFTSFGYNYDGDLFQIQEQPEFDPRTYQHRYNWRSNLDFNLTKTTKFSVKLSGDLKDFNGNQMTKSEAGVGSGSGDASLKRLYQMVLIGPPSVMEDGKLGSENKTAMQPNYLGVLERQGSVSKIDNRFYSDFVLKQELMKGLNFTAKLSFNQNRGYQSEITASPIYYVLNADNEVEQRDLTQQPSQTQIGAESINGYAQSLYYEAGLNYNTKIDKHAISALALFNRREYNNKVAFPYKEESWVGRATYAYDDKYLFEFNGAYNGNENFAPGKRFGFFPSAALGWVVSQENFMKENLSAIEFMKIRYSYGEIGSDKGLGGSRFSYIQSYDSYTPNIYYGYPLGAVGYNGLIYKEGNPADPNNTWETAIKQNLGFEFTFLKGRLRSTVDLFDEKREDIIMSRNTIPSWYGNSMPKANMGETKNHGVDVELKWNDKVGKVNYWATANVSLSENRVVFRDDAPSTPDYQMAAGKPIGYRTGYKDYGYYQSWDDVYNYPNSSFTSNLIPGDLIFMDYTGDGLVDTQDIIPIGNPSSALKTYAFSLGAEYKGLSISAMFNGVFDISKYLSGTYLWCWDTVSSLQYQLLNVPEQQDYWTENNPNALSPVPHATDNSHNKQTSTYTTRASDFLRLRNLEVKYRFPKSVLNQIGMLQNLEVYVNGQNLMTWSSLPDVFDPEASKLEVYPIAKRFNAGLRFTL